VQLKKQTKLMTATLEIHYISGRVHGTPWGTSHNEGAIEFPPSPWRILRSLVATWFERAPELSEETIRSLIAALARVTPTYQVPPFAGAHVRHYLPESSHLRGVKTSTAKVLDAFAAVDTTQPLLVQWKVELTVHEHDALARLAEQLPYLGRAESLVSARLCSPEEVVVAATDSRSVQRGTPTDHSTRPIRLLCPEPDVDWEALIQVPWKLRQQGHVLPPSASPKLFVSDGPLEWPQPNRSHVSSETVTVIEWKLRGKGKIPVTASVAYCETLRCAIMCQFKDREITPPWQVLGKVDGQRADRHHRHAHYLPVSDGKFLTGVLVWIPAGTDFETAEIVGSPRRLYQPDRDGLADFRPVDLFLQHSGPRPLTGNRAFDSSHVWETVTPYAPARFLRTDTRMMSSLHAELTRELAERGIAAPARIEVVYGSPHALDFRRHRVKGERLRDARRAFHVRLTFDRPVAGPISLGALSHFGLGHFRPSLGKSATINSYDSPAVSAHT
jgi:CRISPR-associated protein Csb2